MLSEPQDLREGVVGGPITWSDGQSKYLYRVFVEKSGRMIPTVFTNDRGVAYHICDTREYDVISYVMDSEDNIVYRNQGASRL